MLTRISCGRGAFIQRNFLWGFSGLCCGSAVAGGRLCINKNFNHAFVVYSQTCCFKQDQMQQGVVIIKDNNQFKISYASADILRQRCSCSPQFLPGDFWGFAGGGPVLRKLFPCFLWVVTKLPFQTRPNVAGSNHDMGTQPSKYGLQVIFLVVV